MSTTKKANKPKLLIDKNELVEKVEKLYRRRNDEIGSGAFCDNEWGNFGQRRKVDGIREVLNIIKKTRKAIIKNGGGDS